MKYLFVPVNYNSYDSLKYYIQAICHALDTANNNHILVDICVADNTPEPQEITKDKKEYGKVNIVVRHYDNPGYLSAALKSIYSVDINSYDYIIISNVDVLVDKSFFCCLEKLKLDKQTTWIAPSIYSESEKRDVNPKISERYSKRRLQLLRMLFRFPHLWHFYTKTLYKRKSINTIVEKPQQDIYAGHGSFMIFTKDLFTKNVSMDYPVFLFCEEIFLAEMVRKIGMKTTYFPSIKVYDKEHASTSHMKLSRYCKYNFDAITYILHRFYE